MKKYLLIFILAISLLFSTEGLAKSVLNPQNVVYRGVVTGLCISSVSGYALIDNVGATVLTFADGNHLIEIYDSSGRMLKGYLSSVGDGEDLGPEIVTGWTNHGAYPYETWTPGVAPLITQAVNTTSVADAYKAFTYLANALYKRVSTFTLNSGTLPSFNMCANAAAAAPYVGSRVIAGDETKYLTTTHAHVVYLLYNTTATDFSVSAISQKQVIGPSTNGAVIMSSKGGIVQNFAYKNVSFTYNAESYYVIVRKAR